MKTSIEQESFSPHRRATIRRCRSCLTITSAIVLVSLSIGCQLGGQKKKSQPDNPRLTNLTGPTTNIYASSTQDVTAMPPLQTHTDGTPNTYATSTQEVTTGTNSPSSRQQQQRQSDGRPLIHNIGSTKLLRYEPGKVLQIPIEGQDFANSKSEITVVVEGVSPLIAGEDYTLQLNNSSSLFVCLSTNAVSRFHTKDDLTVTVIISDQQEGTGVDRARFQIGQWLQGPQFSPEESRKISTGHPDEDLAFRLGQAQALAGSTAATMKINKANLVGEQIQASYERGYGQILAFQATPQNPSASSGNELIRSTRAPMLSRESRTFSLYAADDYRSLVLERQINIHNITACPLPFEEARRLFGKLVSEDYYALRLTLKNPSDKDQLVSLGMITAHGRALVTPAKDNKGISDFTKYIQVAPQSQQQVYTMVQNGKVDLKREWFFRSLTFAGALATTYGTGFAASEDYVKAVALATGTVIPGLKELIPDKVPFHLLNIVNFGMPDLVKVPKGGSVDGKYLFFSRSKIQAVLQDPRTGTSELRKALNKPDPYSVRVVSLAFDTLQVPFESAGASPENDLATKVARLEITATTSAAVYAKLKSEWAAGSWAIDGLKWSDYQEFITNLFKAQMVMERIVGGGNSAPVNPAPTATNAPAAANDPVIANYSPKKLFDILNQWTTNAAKLLPASLNSNLFESKTIGLGALTTALARLQDAESGMLQGKPAALFESRVREIEGPILTAEGELSRVNTLAKIIADHQLWNWASKVKADASTNVLAEVLAELSKASAALP